MSSEYGPPMKKAAIIRVYATEDGTIQQISVFAEKYLSRDEVVPALLDYISSNDGRGTE